MILIVIAYLVAGAAAFLVGKRVGGWHPLLVVAAADLVGTVVIFGFSVIHNNSSVYDAYWSVAPPLIGIYWLASSVAMPGMGLRWIILMALVLIWSIRLTLNWAVRWQGMGDEDWRYQDLRKRHGRYYWLVSFFGIHLMPTAVVYLGCFPTFPTLADPVSNLGILDGIATLLTMGAIGIEMRADLDVTRFKRKGGNHGALLQSGLWSLSRHPNYLGEIGFWWGVYLFGLAANHGYWWTFIGPLSITLLFLFISIPMIERRMQARKPEYSRYQQMTPMLLPGVGRRKDSPNP